MSSRVITSGSLLINEPRFLPVQVFKVFPIKSDYDGPGFINHYNNDCEAIEDDAHNQKGHLV